MLGESDGGMTLVTDPIDVLLDGDEDLDFGDGSDLQLSTGIPAVVQALRERLKTFAGEWFLDLDHGVDYYGALLGQKFDPVVAQGAFRPVILATPNVVELLALNVAFDVTTRTLSIEFSVRTAFGDTADSILLTV